MAKAVKQKKPFLKGRIFDLVTSLLGLIVIIVIALQIPIGAKTDTDTVTTLLFAVLGVPLVVAALMIRHGALVSKNRDVKDPQRGNWFYRWFFIWLLIPAIFVALLPWIVSGALNDQDMNAVGVSALILLLPWVSILAGFLVAGVVIYPVEITIRGILLLIKTNGKEGIGRIIVGLYLLLGLAFIVCGSVAVAAVLPGQAGHGALIAALFGIPGAYTVKDDSFLLPARILGVVFVVLPLLYGVIAKKAPKNIVVQQISSVLR